MAEHFFKNVYHNNEDCLPVKEVEQYYPTAYEVADCLVMSPEV